MANCHNFYQIQIIISKLTPMNLKTPLSAYILLLFVLTTSVNFAQIINAESLRKPSDSTKWNGSVSLNIHLIKNVNSIFGISSRAHIQYKSGKSILLFLNDFSFQKIEGNSFINRGTQHLRYNYKLTERVKLEVFVQGQYDAVSLIAFRGLAGIGPRFKLSKNDDYRFYLGSLIMYEYEKSTNVIADRIQRDYRGTTYFSFSLYPNDQVSVISTTYYQPLLESFNDYRIANETSVSFKIFDDLYFSTTFNYNFDAFPVTNDIPKTQYRLMNGLLYSF